MSLGFKGFRDEDRDKKQLEGDTLSAAAQGCDNHGLFNERQLSIIRQAIKLLKQDGSDVVRVSYDKIPGRQKGDVRFIWNIRFEKEFKRE